MYESFYGLRDKPFRLRPDPSFFFGSKGHKRAMSYLEYGLSQGEGFIIVTGEVGAGKTTLVRKLLGKINPMQIISAHIVNTHLDPDNTLRMVASAFGLATENASKAALLTQLEQFFLHCEQKGVRALLVVDEAQNLSPTTLEELRMLSNFQSGERSLLQTFLLGQPEFRITLHSEAMLQLRQRVIATYHLGPMDEEETITYIQHRLRTVGWENDPAFDAAAYAAIHAYSGGIPRKINSLCDRLLLMGYLEELRAFEGEHVQDVIRDIQEEFEQPLSDASAQTDAELRSLERQFADDALEELQQRVGKLENATASILKILRDITSQASRYPVQEPKP
ncbi:AAA family ATPase [Herbaspirillum seropedicae]|uniref:ATP/GTP-binding site motif A (P-loop):AAA ATPase superfamily protein n=1 Tax=Herbaspirillum seropedicae (strain SmR1) TaxID=757424 RepID=D8IYQ3_HERSS|nr:XrtA/PEP-CTERM system-associated ATPase [Herbaspirillum seropedicae]ADJ64238.1 ATP/GTP-binding site motif A (P-loop):AAA ATPase superfamily protein [Herbaspirillum seropedicae SmR1]AKN66189.1 ATPase [Herbaspirillum seropedicae]NQE30724.1 ATPase [Herbaspirillum seropedicae]UMU22181.1 AAA family ATPase [Herbaspirillum seropedicae]